MRRTPPQLELDWTKREESARRGWGGRRAGAGRKRHTPRRDGRPGLPHRARPEHDHRHPLHVTMRAGLGSLRGQAQLARLVAAFRQAGTDTFRIVHYSVQHDHVHLIVEAADRRALTRGMRGLAVRCARGVNRVLGRRGQLWSDRYHARPLTRPRAVRNALVYVLMNHRKHRVAVEAFDSRSSAAWFDGWRRDPVHEVAQSHALAVSGKLPAVGPPRTWLAATGWRKHGLLAMDEMPRSGSAGRRS